jgi:CheY-like chemotaxis protein
MNDEQNRPQPSGALLLFSDDNADDLLYCEKALRREGIHGDLRVVPANEEAFRWLQGQPPYNNRNAFPFPDVLVLDLKAGELDGRELLRWIRSTHAFDGLPVIIHTGEPDPQHKADCLKVGANDYIAKDPDCVELMHCVARMLDHRR